ncbi:MAG: protein phosphatase 2C domain-containing protein [Terracidiphilus sp.]|jgi:protein phosphatase
MSKTAVVGHPVVLFAEECDRGSLREENQDTVLHVHIPLGDLMIVADGVGGNAEGATASRMVVESFYAHLSMLPHDYPAGNAIREAAERANTQILEAARATESEHERMGSTVVVALVQQETDGIHAWIGHIGDSRAYLARAGRLHCLTIDHSVVQDLLDRRLITPEEAEHHPEASMLARSLGYQSKVEIDIEQVALGVGDTLLLCSDGLWGFVPEYEIAAALDVPDRTLQAAAHNLLELALATGGHDNIGIEMARLILPHGIVAPQHEKHIHPIAKWIVAFFLLSVIGLCVLAYLAFWAS